MGSQEITKDRLDYTVDVLISMTVAELADELQLNEEELLEDFLLSKTGQALYDTDTELWHNGPTYLAEIYKQEKGIE